jgi:hypothetical protein
VCVCGGGGGGGGVAEKTLTPRFPLLYLAERGGKTIQKSPTEICTKLWKVVFASKLQVVYLSTICVYAMHVYSRTIYALFP